MLFLASSKKMGKREKLRSHAATQPRDKGRFAKRPSSGQPSTAALHRIDLASSGEVQEKQYISAAEQGEGDVASAALNPPRLPGHVSNGLANAEKWLDERPRTTDEMLAEMEAAVPLVDAASKAGKWDAARFWGDHQKSISAEVSARTNGLAEAAKDGTLKGTAAGIDWLFTENPDGTMWARSACGRWQSTFSHESVTTLAEGIEDGEYENSYRRDEADWEYLGEMRARQSAGFGSL